MYPKTYYETFMRYEASNEVFIAMPFSADFARVYTTILGPAVRSVAVNGVALEPRVVNRSTHGAPDIHEVIYDAILHSRLVIADMTVQACHDSATGRRWQPNANVAYEVGIAAGWRNQEDILLIHQAHPSHAYSFDVQNLRHVQYDANDAAASIQLIANEISEALNRSRFISNQAYLKLINSMSPLAGHFIYHEMGRIFPALSFQQVDVSGVTDMRVAVITELIAMGALRSHCFVKPGVSAPGHGLIVIYRWTDLGLRLARSWGAADEARVREIREKSNSVPEGTMPPREMLNFPATPATASDGSTPPNT